MVLHMYVSGIQAIQQMTAKSLLTIMIMDPVYKSDKKSTGLGIFKTKSFMQFNFCSDLFQSAAQNTFLES